jgi:hypothetical protein
MTFDEWNTQFPYTPPEDVDWTSCGVRLGPDGGNAVEVVWGSGGSGSKSTLRKVWKDRKGSRVNPVVAVHYTDSQAIVMGPGREGAAPSATTIRDVDQLSRILDAALVLEDRHKARQFLDKYLPHAGSPALGVHNSGLLATHALHRASDEREDWGQLSIRGKTLLDQRRRKLMEGLGFQVQQSSQQHSILRVDGEGTAIALFLQPNENPDGWFVERFGSEAPVLYALRMAERENVDWVVITTGPTVRLYPTSTTVGVGRRGRTETFCEVRLDLLSETNAGYLPLLFSSGALKPDGYLKDLIERSADHVAELGKRLRDRIYGNILPRLATGIAEARELDAPTTEDLSQTHDMALTLLFRLLFISYAEDRVLLPYGENEEYTKVALKTLAKTFTPSEENPEIEFNSDSAELWANVSSIVKAIHDGRDEWSIPAYGGTPFTEDENIKPSGARLAEIELDDSVFGPVLQGLLIDRGADDEIGPIDFRELSVREFGTIYEGLLESELALATEDLAEDNKGYYRPASGNDTVVVENGEFYLHNSGKRKSSASFYTKSFAVEHLLDRSLEPALDEHLARVDAIEDDEEASRLIFDFRVADISMGSGHFLIAAIDHIERKFSNYLSQRPLEGIMDELNRLWRLAAERTGKDAESMGIDHNQLLRRQIARRCVYGVDINPTAVELARVSVWIHTFVPGIPLSFLDWRLRCGNSIIGIATQEEANRIISEHSTQASLFQDWQGDSTDEVAEIAQQMAEIGEGSDTTLEEVSEAMENYRTTRDRLRPWKALMDVMCASRIDSDIEDKIGRVVRNWKGEANSVEQDDIWPTVRETLAANPPFHFQIEFPEVFWRENPGFDVIMGNPPWEEATIEEDGFWTKYVPGLQGLPQHERDAIRDRWRADRPDLVAQFEAEQRSTEQMRNSLTSGAFPGMETGDPDLYKAFCWRFFLLLREGGQMGVVLPRSAFSVLGSAPFRRQLYENATFRDLTFTENKAGWVFDEAEHRYTIGLVAIEHSTPNEDAVVPVRGPYNSFSAYRTGLLTDAVPIPVSVIVGGSDAVAIPLLPTHDIDHALAAMAQMRTHPRFDADISGEFRFRPVAEFHATHDKPHMIVEENPPNDVWPVYGGKSFDIWDCDTGVYFAHIDPEVAQTELNRKRAKPNRRSAFYEMSEEWRTTPSALPCLNARIAFRDVTRSTDTRTTRIALLPPNRAITNKGPYLLKIRGDEIDEAFILAIMASTQFDWFSRRYVEINLNFFILNPLPIPRPEQDDPLRLRAIQLAGRLAAHDSRLSNWAAAVGVECGELNTDEKRVMVMELDAVIAQLYGLSERQLESIYRTFHHDGTVDGEPWQERFDAVIEHYRRWSE